LAGLPGMGKSLLALNYAHKFYENTYQFIIWIDDRTQEAYEQSLRAVTKSKLFNTEQKKQYSELQFEQLEERLFNYLDHEPFEKPWLLILDHHEKKRENLPQQGYILFTARTNHLGAKVKPFEIEELSSAESVAYLRQMTGETNTQQLHALVEKLGNVPQLIHLAAKYISAVPGSSVDNYVSVINKLDPAFLAPYRLFLPMIFPVMGWLTQFVQKEVRHKQILTSVWLETFQQLKKKNPLAADWLEMCAYLDAENIPLDGIEDWLSLKKFESPNVRKSTQETIVRDLRDFIFELAPHAETFSIHRSIQEIIRDQTSNKTEKIQEAKLLVHKKMSGFDWNIPESWTMGAKWYLHAATMIKHAMDMKIELTHEEAVILDSLSTYFLSIRSGGQALPLINLAIAIEQKNPSKLSQTHLVKFLNDRGAILLTLKNPAHRNDFQQALDIVKDNTLQMTDKKEILRTLINAAVVENTKGNYQKGREHLHEADKIHRSLYGDQENLLKAKILIGLSQSEVDDNPEQSARDCDQGLTMYERCLEGKDLYSFANVVALMATTYINKNKEKSLSLHLKSQDLFNTLNPGDTIAKATILNNLGLLQKDPKLAINFYKQSLAMYERLDKSSQSTDFTLHSIRRFDEPTAGALTAPSNKVSKKDIERTQNNLEIAQKILENNNAIDNSLVTSSEQAPQ
jgi:hypothetical protein